MSSSYIIPSNQLRPKPYIQQHPIQRSFRPQLKWFCNRKTRRICNWLIPITFVYLHIQLSPTSRFLPSFRKLHSKNLKCTHWSDVACTLLLWKGEALADIPPKENNEIEATVVISYCGEDEDMNTFTNYINNDINGNITVTNMAIISRCASPFRTSISQNLTDKNNIALLQSQWQHPLLNFMEWLTLHLESSMSKSLPEYYQHEEHVILFLSSGSIGNTDMIRTLDQVVQSTMENKFGCFLQPPDPMSYYHAPLRLRTYAHPETNQTTTGEYNDLGQWLDHLNTSWIFNELVPVCYGNSFAIKSKDLYQNPERFYKVLMAMISDYNTQQHMYHHTHNELVQFMERSMAALFSHRLSEEKIRLLREYKTKVYKGPDYVGALYHSWKEHFWYRLFTGDTLEKHSIDYSKVRLTLVISHCRENMSWIQNKFSSLNNLNIQNVYIYSKCDSPVTSYQNPNAVVIRQPNIGRCDHSYAHWMAGMKEEDNTDNHVVLFFKASRDLYQPGLRYRHIRDVIRIAMEHGFSCEAEHVDTSMYHQTNNLKAFQIATYKGFYIKSSYDNMGEWLKNLDIRLPSPLTPVCYGGNFAVKASQIYSRNALWQKMTTSLERAESIEEGHFAERAWAGILSYPLNLNESAVMESLPSKVGEAYGPYGGAIRLDE